MIDIMKIDVTQMMSFWMNFNDIATSYMDHMIWWNNMAHVHVQEYVRKVTFLEKYSLKVWSYV